MLTNIKPKGWATSSPISRIDLTGNRKGRCSVVGSVSYYLPNGKTIIAAKSAVITVIKGDRNNNIYMWGDRRVMHHQSAPRDFVFYNTSKYNYRRSNIK